MAREQLDDSLLDPDEALRANLKKLARREKRKKQAANQVHEIATKASLTGKSRQQTGQRKKRSQTLGTRWAGKARVLVIGGVVLLACGYLGGHIYAWYKHDDYLASGAELFSHEWVPNDERSYRGDGLGPVFNANSCVACHFQGGVGGAGPNSRNVETFEVFGVQSRPVLVTGSIHSAAIVPSFQESFDKLRVLYPVEPGGVVTPPSGCFYRIPEFDPILVQSVSTPPLFGAGLIDKISGWSIGLTLGKTGVTTVLDELNGDGKASLGRVRYLPDGRIGKFGWKAQFATLEEFVASACAMECGLSNPLAQQIQPTGFAVDQQADYDMSREMLHSLVVFCADLPKPVQVVPEHPQIQAAAKLGEARFAEIGCADCHKPKLGSVEGIYSDLLLHIVEDSYVDTEYVSLPDNVIPPPTSHPRPDEWKTPPLWGVADSAPYWHDGSCVTLESAILKHTRQAKRVTQKYKELPVQEQKAILVFLKTLRAPQVPAATPEVIANAR